MDTTGVTKLDGFCAHCNQYRPPNRWGAHKSWCLDCLAKAGRDHRSRLGNDVVNQRQNEWNKNNPSKRARYKRKAHLKAMYGLTEDRLLELLDEQGGKCLGCDQVISYGGRGKGVAVIDHDHSTGLYRGILCTDCNFILGHCDDDETTLYRLISYLRKSRAVSA